MKLKCLIQPTIPTADKFSKSKMTAKTTSMTAYQAVKGIDIAPVNPR